MAIWGAHLSPRSGLRLRLPSRRRLRPFAIAWGTAAFLWLGPESDAIWPPAALGLGLAALLALWWTADMAVTALAVVPVAVLLGALTGLGTAPAAALLMLFKNALHAHVFPDYPPGLVLAVLERAPAWALAGALAGLGLTFVWWALRGRGDR